MKRKISRVLICICLCCFVAGFSFSVSAKIEQAFSVNGQQGIIFLYGDKLETNASFSVRQSGGGGEVPVTRSSSATYWGNYLPGLGDGKVYPAYMYTLGSNSFSNSSSSKNVSITVKQNISSENIMLYSGEFYSVYYQFMIRNPTANSTSNAGLGLLGSPTFFLMGVPFQAGKPNFDDPHFDIEPSLSHTYSVKTIQYNSIYYDVYSIAYTFKCDKDYLLYNFTFDFPFSPKAVAGQRLYPVGLGLYGKLNNVDVNSSIAAMGDKISSSIEEQTDKIVNENYGYKKPSSPNADKGLADGNKIINDSGADVGNLDSQIKDANAQLSVIGGKTKDTVTALWNALPLPVTGLIILLLVFVVVRKVVGR